MSNAGSKYNFDFQGFFNEAFDLLELEARENLETSNDEQELTSFDASLRDIWNKQLALREEKVGHPASAGELAQRFLSRVNSSAH